MLPHDIPAVPHGIVWNSERRKLKRRELGQEDVTADRRDSSGGLAEVAGYPVHKVGSQYICH